MCFGVNPSTASPEQLDNTIKSIQRIANINNFDSWIMLNVYPQRATNPNHLDHLFNIELHIKNIYFINEILSKSSAIYAAWGNIIERRPYLTHCLKEIFDISKINNCKWFKFGESTKLGHPKHPLYLKKDIEILNFETQECLLKHKSAF